MDFDFPPRVCVCGCIYHILPCPRATLHQTGGKAHYITEGMLRVSSRKLLHQAPTSPSSSSSSVQDFPGLPRHSFRRADAQPLEPGGAPVEVGAWGEQKKKVV